MQTMLDWGLLQYFILNLLKINTILKMISHVLVWLEICLTVKIGRKNSLVKNDCIEHLLKLEVQRQMISVTWNVALIGPPSLHARKNVSSGVCLGNSPCLLLANRKD